MMYLTYPNRSISRFFLISALLVVAASCGTPNTDQALIGTKAHSVGTRTKLESLIQASQWNYYGPGALEDAVPTPGDSTNQSTGGETRDYVDTNVQVEGVAEGDIVKTDGFQIYYTPRYMNKINIFNVNAEHQISVDTILDLKDVYTDSLYLTKDYLIVVGYTYETAEGPCFTDRADASEVGCYAMMWWNPTGTILVYDRTSLEVVYQVETDSVFMNHRMIEDSLFLVGHRYIYNTNEELRPSYQIGETSEFIDYSDIYYYEDTPVNGMTVLTGIKLTANPDEIKLNGSAYLGAAYSNKQIYVSLTDLYVADTNYLYDQNSYYQTMTISQFSIDVDFATMTYVGATLVEGGMLNQFSMDAYNGYLRVATTNNGGRWEVINSNEWSNWQRIVENHLYVLKLNPSKESFNLISHISEGLGKPNESIQSVRFSGTQAYIVTFLRTDPLYIIDLSDPRNPVVTDEIELPGYDTYQHPWGENRLLGIGYQADENGAVTGMKLSAYNTTSGSASEIQTLELSNENSGGMGTWSYSYSEALWNHKALLVSVEHGLFGFPVQAYEFGYTNEPIEGENWYYRYHSYYYLFRIDFTKENPIPEPIIIEHPYTDSYYVNVDRAVMIEGYVYTLSDQQVITYDLAANAIVKPPLVINPSPV